MKRTESEALLTDNGSDDGTSRFVSENFPWLRVQRNDNRTGYGGNHNLNLARAAGRYIVIMNCDMTVTPNVLVALRDFMDGHADVGIVAPKILNPDGTVQGLNRRSPTIADLLLRRLSGARVRRMFMRRMDRYEMRDVGYDCEYDVPCLSGCFMFCDSDLLRAVGGFDERYFLYFEDYDLCRRVQASRRTVYYPGATVTHYWERAAHKSVRHTGYFVASAFRYFNRWGYRIF